MTLPEDQRDDILLAIIDYGITGKVEIPLNPMLQLALKPIFAGIDTQKRRYRNVTLLNRIIDEVYRHSLSYDNKKDKACIEKTLKALKKLVITVRKKDCAVYEWALPVEGLLNDSKVGQTILSSSIWKSVYNFGMNERKLLIESKNKDKENE